MTAIGRARFFDAFRSALARAPAGLLRVGPPASARDLDALAARVGRPVPADYVEFLRSWNGADLFHESLILAGTGAGAARRLEDLNPAAGDGAASGRHLPGAVTPREWARSGTVAGALCFGESALGDSFVFDGLPGAERVLRLRDASEERWLAGTSFRRWLDAAVARDMVLYDSAGEFVPDAFEPDGEELTPAVQLRRAERALRKDPGAAEHHHELGVALRRQVRGRKDARLERAQAAFARAAELDPTNPWPWFDLGRAAIDRGEGAAAVEAFQRGAACLRAPAESGRFLAWAARAAHEAGLVDVRARAAAEAVRLHPDLPDDLARAAAASATAGDLPARDEAEALLVAVVPGALPPRRLPILE